MDVVSKFNLRYLETLETVDSTNNSGHANCNLHEIPSSNNILSRFQVKIERVLGQTCAGVPNVGMDT